MRSILIIVDTDDRDKELRDEIIKNIDNHVEGKVEKYFLYLDDMNLNPCVGCFNCWVKTPGKCIINDDNELKNRLFIECDYIVLVSRILYGMYSPSFKVILDRMIPNISPFFQLANGEMHHKKRYKKDFKMFVIGYSTKLYTGEASTFKELFNRNMINFHCKENEFLILEDSNNIQNKITTRLDNLCGVN